MKELFNLFNRKDIFGIYACKSELGYTREVNQFQKGVRFSKLEDWMKADKINCIKFLFEDNTKEFIF